MRSHMNRGSVLKRAALGCSVTAILALGAASASASPYLSIDFESPNVAGSAPSSPTPSIAGASGYQVKVVDSSTTPTDPFAASGNQSLWMQSPASLDTNSTSAQISWTGASGGLSTGTFSGDFYKPSGNYGEFRLGTAGLFSSGSNIGVWLGLSGTTVKSYGSTSYTMDQTAASGTKHTISVTFDVTTHTFTGKLDGVAMTANSGAVSVFPFLSAVAHIDTIGADVGYSTATQQAFYDNLNINPVPEPGTLSLLGIGAVALLRRRRR